MGINKTLEIAGKVGIKQGVDNCKESNHKTLIIAFDLILFFFFCVFNISFSSLVSEKAKKNEAKQTHEPLVRFDYLFIFGIFNVSFFFVWLVKKLRKIRGKKLINHFSPQIHLPKYLVIILPKIKLLQKLTCEMLLMGTAGAGGSRIQ